MKFNRNIDRKIDELLRQVTGDAGIPQLPNIDEPPRNAAEAAARTIALFSSVAARALWTFGDKEKLMAEGYFKMTPYHSEPLPTEKLSDELAPIVRRAMPPLATILQGIR